jgi:8-oxo-dGTP pyrophosphatase MutT (NUDIX family)
VQLTDLGGGLIARRAATGVGFDGRRTETTSIDWVSPAERANRSRRNPRRRGGHGERTNQRMRTVRETSAGGLVVDGLDGPRELQCAALIGRTDRRGRLLWSLPKGHIEQGETAEQTAIREVAEETGIRGSVLASLGSIDYWFVTEGRRIHKTVHHYLLRFQGGELSDEDVEVTEVAWVPLAELASRLAYADERRLAEVAGELLDRIAAGQEVGDAGSANPDNHSGARENG